MENIGERIRVLRLQHGLTLEELGNRIGVGKSTVRKWEQGMISDIRQTNLAKLSKALGTTPEKLMGWEEFDRQHPEMEKEVLLIEQVCHQYGTLAAEMLSLFVQLNEAGCKRAMIQIEDLLEIPKYRKENEA